MKRTSWLDRMEIDRSADQVRKFGLILALLIIGYSGVRSWLTHDVGVTGVLIGLGIGLIALVLPRVLTVIYVPWMIAARSAGFIITHLLLSMVFYLIFTPVGWIMRLAGRDPLRLKQGGNSYWIARDPDRKTDYERMF